MVNLLQQTWEMNIVDNGDIKADGASYDLNLLGLQCLGADVQGIGGF